jgi:hypothetical protein
VSLVYLGPQKATSEGEYYGRHRPFGDECPFQCLR